MLTLNPKNSTPPLTEQEEQEIIEILKEYTCTERDSDDFWGNRTSAETNLIQLFLNNYSRMKEGEKAKREASMLDERIKSTGMGI